MENKPQIPTLKESQNDKKGAPILKIKGLQNGLSLMERLKQFKKKDLAFILAGLGVLFMAPLAEHFMMSPNDQGSDAMTPGFSKNGGSSPFGSGSSPYEPGISGLAPGGTVGNGSDVITPLNVRDPSALVMGPGQTQQAPATSSQPSAAPPPPPPSKDDSKWNDAIAAGKAAASAATHKAALPVPHVPLSAGGLRGLGAISGGSGSSFSLPPISSNGLASGHVNQSNGLTGTSGSGIKGVARGPNTGGTGNLEKLKQEAASAGGDFNRAGSASTALEQAANRDMSGGGNGGGAGEGGGQGDKAASGSQNKDSKSPGESLEFLRQKMQMEKDIAFADELRKNDPSCLFSSGPCMERNKIFSQGEETLISKGLVEPIASAMGNMISGLFDSSAKQGLSCVTADGTPKYIDAGTWAKSCNGGDGKTSPVAGKAWCLSDDGLHAVYNGAPQNPATYPKCSTAADTTNPPGKTKQAVDSMEGSLNQPWNGGHSLSEICNNATGAVNKNTGGEKAAVIQSGDQAARVAGYNAIKGAAADLAAIEKTVDGHGGNASECGTAPDAMPTSAQPLNARLDAVRQKMRSAVSVLRYSVLKPDADMAGSAGADGSGPAPLWKTEGDAQGVANDFFSKFGTPIADASAGGQGSAPAASGGGSGTTSAAAPGASQYLFTQDDVKSAEQKFKDSFGSLKPDTVQAADTAMQPYATNPEQAPTLQGVKQELSDILNVITQTDTALQTVTSKAASATAGQKPDGAVAKELTPSVTQVQGEVTGKWQPYMKELRLDQSTLSTAYDQLTGLVGSGGVVTKAHAETYAALTAAAPAQQQGILAALAPTDGAKSFSGQVTNAFDAMAATPITKTPSTDDEKTAAKGADMPLIQAQQPNVQKAEQAIKATQATVTKDLGAAQTALAPFDNSLKGREGTPAAITGVEAMPTPAAPATGAK